MVPGNPAGRERLKFRRCDYNFTLPADTKTRILGEPCGRDPVHRGFLAEATHSAHGAGRPRVTASPDHVLGHPALRWMPVQRRRCSVRRGRASDQLREDLLLRALNAGFTCGVRQASPRTPRRGARTGRGVGEPAGRSPPPPPRKTSCQNASLIRTATRVQSVPPAPAPRIISRLFASSSTTSMPGMCLPSVQRDEGVPSLPLGVKRMGMVQLDPRKKTGRTEHSVRPVPSPAIQGCAGPCTVRRSPHQEQAAMRPRSARATHHAPMPRSAGAEAASAPELLKDGASDAACALGSAT